MCYPARLEAPSLDKDQPGPGKPPTRALILLKSEAASSIQFPSLDEEGRAGGRMCELMAWKLHGGWQSRGDKQQVYTSKKTGE